MRLWIIIASISGFIAVAIGAMGAHTLKPLMTPEGLANFQTTSEYHMYHSLALIGCGLLHPHFNNHKFLKYAGITFCIGIILFSGNLYWLAITGSTPFHYLIPVGGAFFLLGWIFMGWSTYYSHLKTRERQLIKIKTYKNDPGGIMCEM
jgi:uncharacterized membrane protein YgdD (TMEM256/DUF423 family)